MIKFHFLNVGQGNMAIGIFPDGKILAYDCNITDDNEGAVFGYLQQVMSANASIDVFVNSHRDADHMRGIKKLHAKYPIGALWDSGVSGNTETSEYEEYMDFRSTVASQEVEPNSYWTSHPSVRILNGKREGLNDPNSQSIVLHIDYNGSSILLAGDTNVNAWRDYIIPESGDGVRCLVLFASHHGSHTFFNEDRENQDDHTHHLALMSPAITLISVGENNPHGHPDEDSLRHYENHCHGTVETQQKIFRTDQHRNMSVDLYGNGTGMVYWNR